MARSEEREEEIKINKDSFSFSFFERMEKTAVIIIRSHAHSLQPKTKRDEKAPAVPRPTLDNYVRTIKSYCGQTP